MLVVAPTAAPSPFFHNNDINSSTGSFQNAIVGLDHPEISLEQRHQELEQQTSSTTTIMSHRDRDDSSMYSEESDGGWSDDDGDSTEEHEEDPLGNSDEDMVAFNGALPAHNHKNTKTVTVENKQQPSEERELGDEIENQKQRLEAQRKRFEAMQQQQQEFVSPSQAGKGAISSRNGVATSPSPSTPTKTNASPVPSSPSKLHNLNLGAVVGNEDAWKKGLGNSPRTEKDRRVREAVAMGNNSGRMENEEDDSDTESDSDDESTSSSSESSSEGDGGIESEETDGIARQEQNVKNVTKALKVDATAHDRWLAYFNKKQEGEGAGGGGGGGDNDGDDVPKEPKRRSSGKSAEHHHKTKDDKDRTGEKKDSSKKKDKKDKKKKDKKSSKEKDRKDKEKKSSKEKKEKKSSSKDKKDKKKKSSKKEKKSRNEAGAFDWTAYSVEHTSGEDGKNKDAHHGPKRAKSEGVSKDKKKKEKGVTRAKTSDCSEMGSPKKRGAKQKVVNGEDPAKEEAPKQ